MVEQHKKELEKKLWDIANSLRGNMSPDDFRDYILGFIFYKYLSEKMDKYGSKLLTQSPEIDTDEFDELDEGLVIDGDLVIDDIKEEAIAELGYFLKPSELFHVIAKRGKNGEFILESLGEVLNHIEQSTMGTASEDDFNGLFDDIDFTSNKLGKTEKAKNELITSVLGHLDKIDFCLDDTEIDVLGDAYEYLIGQFASGAGKKAGEFYTPPMVSKLLAKLVTKGKTQLKSVYDPTCGSGSLLLQVSKEISRKNNGEIGGISNYYGQEKNPSTYNLARMNMILHGVHYRSFDIQQDDTLETPHHIEKRFEAVVANPPFSADWSAHDSFKSDERFADYGKLAPKSKADFAFVQHMLHQLDDNGIMAVVLPHGVLFRGATEGHIRKYLIEQKNWLDAVIGLPANIFYGTPIPTCILVLKKQRKFSDNILFIDASAHCGKATNQNFLREEDLDRILEAVEKRDQLEPEKADKFAYVATREKIKKENDYNLNIPRYVDTFEEELTVELSTVTAQLNELESEMTANDELIIEFCNQLNIKAPVGANK